jgi:hypothetical protein
MADFTYNVVGEYADIGDTFSRVGTQVASGTLSDGEANQTFENGDVLSSIGDYRGTTVINGETFVIVQTGGGNLLYGEVSDPVNFGFPSSFPESQISTDPFTVCFAAGTLILTDRGEVAVEALRAGDVAITEGLQGPRRAPVLWIGRRRIVLAGHSQAAALAPVRIRAGALGEGLPRRDLLVSPDHCLLIGGRLVPARLLVNGTTVVAETLLAEVTYFHVELEHHDALIAEGVPAESWLDCGNRGWFANAPVPLLHVAGTPDRYATTAATPCAPVLHGGAELAAIRDAIAARAPSVLAAMVEAATARRVA